MPTDAAAQFNKRTDFWMISFAWSFPFLNLILEVNYFLTCNSEKLIFYVLFKYSFGKKAFGFVCIISIDFFFLATTLVITTFDSRFWWAQDKIRWLVLFDSIFFSNFFIVLLNKSNCFRTLELDVFQLFVILQFFIWLPDRFDIVLFQIYCIIDETGQNNVFCRRLIYIFYIYHDHFLESS